jgi:hypothetical protein
LLHAHQQVTPLILQCPQLVDNGCYACAGFCDI